MTRPVQSPQPAPAEVETLSGLLPMCRCCRKIRNDQGAWQVLEPQVRAHTRTEFTHGSCPDCLKQLHPDYAERVLKG